jgi:hypothetical protein
MAVVRPILAPFRVGSSLSRARTAKMLAPATSPGRPIFADRSATILKPRKLLADTFDKLRALGA